MVMMGSMSTFPSSPKRKKSTTKALIDTDEDKFSSVPNAKKFGYGELQTATGDFDVENKIGEGGFGIVYKGILNDGTLIAIKVLSTRSERGVSVFLDEIEVLSRVEHKNLVKLYGYCIERYHRMLVDEYLEKNTLAQELLGGHCNRFEFSWQIRSRICIELAQGLAFLHEGVKPRIVHGDIKARNVLLDKDFTPKILDFGLPRLFSMSMTCINVGVGGSFGYLSPEYVFTGTMTWTSDVYSFGILLLEIVSGRSMVDTGLRDEEQNLLSIAWSMHKRGKLDQLVDETLKVDSSTNKACKYLKIGLLCIQERPARRPNMSVVAKMLKGEIDVDEIKMPKPGKLMAPKSNRFLWLPRACF